MYAIGGNPEAARLSGIRTTRYKVAAYVIASLLAGLGGILLASRIGSSQVNAGGGYLMDATEAMQRALIGCGIGVHAGQKLMVARQLSPNVGALFIANRIGQQFIQPRLDLRKALVAVRGGLKPPQLPHGLLKRITHGTASFTQSYTASKNARSQATARWKKLHASA